MWKLQIASMKGRHVNARNIKEEDFNRPVEDFTPENAEIISVKMYVVKVPKMKKNKVTVSVVLPVFNKSDFSDSSRIDIKKLRRVLHENLSTGENCSNLYSTAVGKDGFFQGTLSIPLS